MKKTETMTIRLTKEQKQFIQNWANEFDGDVSDLIRRALIAKAFEEYSDNDEKIKKTIDILI